MAAAIRPQCKSQRTRDPAVYWQPQGGETTAWQCFASARTSELPFTTQKARFEQIKEQQALYKRLPEVEKRPWREAAARNRSAARGRGAPLDAALADLESAGAAGGPWGLSSDRVEASGPLSRWAIEEQLEEVHDFKGAARAWQDEMNFVWGESAGFPDSVDLAGACREGECCHNLNPRQEHRYAAISEELRLLLRHSGLPDDSRLCVELRCGDEVRYALIGDPMVSQDSM